MRYVTLLRTGLQAVCHDVAVEPPLQRLTGETINCPCNCKPTGRAHADIHACKGIWGPRQSAFLTLGFSTQMYLVIETQLPSYYRRHEQEKKREYGNHAREVEKASVTTLVFATTGDMGKEATVLYHSLAVPLRTMRCIVLLWPG